MPKFLYTCIVTASFVFAFSSVQADPALLGDLDEDQVFTANDLAKLVGHTSETTLLSPSLVLLADLTQDGVLNEADHEALVKLILETSSPQALPLASVRYASPHNGEGDVAVTRETVIYFTMPLSLSATLDTNQLYAEFGGRKILSRVEISPDKKKATLFYLEPLPSKARMKVTFAPEGLTDLLGRPVDPDGDGTAGGGFITTFDTLSITAIPGTAIQGQVLASEVAEGGADVPLAGVTVSVDGAEETLRTTTDETGHFTLSPCPAGSFFVHVDGRTSPVSIYPNGNYYPTVGKRWEAVAGRMDNESGNSQDTARGKIYLPFIQSGTLAPVSMVEETDIGFPESVMNDFPELEGTLLQVPANSLFADDGTRGGQVGIAPVAANRLPSPLPPGLNLPMVITIQTDGASNFDIPVPVTFPNLPDPVTHQKLPPGAKSALFSFNHDTGEWEIVGPMTVTEDGNFVKTDAGVGVLQPGWHGAQQGAGGAGTPPRGPPPENKPPCVSRNAWEWATLTLDVAKEAAACAAEFAKIKNALKCALALGDQLRVTLVNASTLQTSIAKGDSLEVIDNALGVLDADLAAADGLMNCFNAADPVKKVTAIFECVGNALAIADSVCQFNDNPDATPNCRAGVGSRTFCTGIAGARGLHTEVKLYVDLVKGLEDQAALAAITYSVKQARQVVAEIKRRKSAVPNGARRAFAAVGTQLTPAERDEIRTALGKVQEALSQGVKAMSNIEKMSKAVDNLQASTDDMMTIAGRDIKAWGQPVQGSHYYYLATESAVRRGRTSSAGAASFILPPDERYELTMYDAGKKEMGTSIGGTGANGTSKELNPMAFRSVNGMMDSDLDGLVDAAERVIGTNPDDSDTDNDGILDGAEIEQDSDPLGGFIARTGVVASVPTSSAATDVATANNFAVTANGTAGINVFNISSGLNPTLMAEIDTPGNAVAVALDGNLAAVADSASGLTIVDLSDPTNIHIRHQVNLDDDVCAVHVSGPVAYAGTIAGKVVAVDMASGLVLDDVQLATGEAIQDIAAWQDAVYGLQTGKLTAINSTTFVSAGTLTLPGSIGAGGRRLRLFAGEGTLYATHTEGFNIVDTQTNPLSPTLVQHFTTAQFGWKQIVANGSGLAMAAVSPNSTNDGPHNVELYNLGASHRQPVFGAMFETPGLAAAVSIFNGLAYVADTGSGLQVVSYLAFDNLGLAPGISISATFELDQEAGTGQAEEGKLMRVSSLVTDDVQVRNVEYYVDGSLAKVDGNYPFDFRFVTPLRTPAKQTFTLRAKATDTGGNATWTPEFIITLMPDIFPPQVTRVRPHNLAGNVSTILGTFNEPLNPSTVTASTFTLTGSGPDGTVGTGDDVAVSPSLISYREDMLSASMEFAEKLAAGRYLAVLTGGIQDLAGNGLATNYSWEILVDNEKVYWVGPEEGLWQVPENWSTGQVPGAGQTVVIDAPAGTKVLIDGANIAARSITVQGGATLALSDAKYAYLNDTTLNSDLVIGNGSALYVQGPEGLTLNNANIIMNSQGSYTAVYFTNGGGLAGTGEVIEAYENGYCYFYNYYPATVGEGITVRVKGRFDFIGSSNPLIMRGTIVNETASARVLYSSVIMEGTMQLSTGTMNLQYNTLNRGTVELSGTGVLQLGASSEIISFADLGTINRTGGTVEVTGIIDLGGGVLNLNASTGDWVLKGGTIKGGSLSTSDGSLVRMSGYNTGTLDGVHLQGNVLVTDDATLVLKGDWINDGVITATDAIVNLDGVFKLSEIGTINRTGSEVNIVGVLDNAGQTLVLNSLPDAVKIGWEGTVRGGAVAAFSGGSLTQPQNAKWIFDGVTLVDDLTMDYNTTLIVRNGLTLDNANIEIGGAGGALHTGVTLQFEGAQTLGGHGEIRSMANVADSGLLVVLYPYYDNDTGVLLEGGLTIGPDIVTRLERPAYFYDYYEKGVVNQGTILLSGVGAEVTLNGAFTNTGTVNISAGSLYLGGYYGLDWKNEGIFNLSGSGILYLGDTFTVGDLGTLNRTGGTVNLVGTLDLTGNTLALNSATGSWNLGLSSSYLIGTIKGGSVTTADGAVLTVTAQNQGVLDGVNLQGNVVVNEGTLKFMGEWVNAGSITATNGHLQFGGEFRLNELGTLNRTGGTLKIIGVLDNAGSILVLDDVPDTLKIGNMGTIKGGTITGTGGSLDIGSISQCTFDGVTLGSNVNVIGTTLYLRNGITFSSTDIVLKGGSLYCEGEQTLGGTGRVVFGQTQYTNTLYALPLPDNYSAAGTVTLGANITVRSDYHGNVYQTGNIRFLNLGTFRVDTPNTYITIWPDTVINQGQYIQENGGTIVFY